MKKGDKLGNLLFVSLSIIVLSSAFVSAGWLSDFLGFTGHAIDDVIGNSCEPMLGDAMCQGNNGIDYYCKDLEKDEGICVECLEDSHCLNGSCVDDKCVIEEEEENETNVTVITTEGDYKAWEGSVIKMNGLEVRVTDIYRSSSVNIPSYVSFQSEMNAYVYDIKEGESDKIAYGSAIHPLSYNLQLYVHSVSQDEIILGVYEINEPINYTEENETENDSILSNYSCPSLIDLVANPGNLTISGEVWELEYAGGSATNNGDSRYYADWYLRRDESYAYTSSNVRVDVYYYPDTDQLESKLNTLLEDGICSTERISSYNSDENKIVYICQGMWSITEELREVYSNDYYNDMSVIWFNGNTLVEIESWDSNRDRCYSTSSCLELESREQEARQEDIIDFLDKLIDNDNTYIYTGLSYPSSYFINYLFDVCPSELEEDNLGTWTCRLDPVVCPPHGEQTQVCWRYNDGEEETKTDTIECNPGICSGCMVPKYFGSQWSSQCIEYGFRFEQQNGFEWISYNYTTGGLDEWSGKISVWESLLYYDEINLWIKPNNTMNIWFSEIGNFVNNNGTIHYLSIGDKLDLLELADMELYDTSSDSELPIQFLLNIDNIYYDPENYNNSYFEYTITEEYPEEIHSVDYEVPAYFNMYCDIDGKVKQQKTNAWGSCQNNFECESNLCSYGECVDLKGIADEVTGFKGFIVKMLCRIGNMFDEDNYLTCVSENA